MDRIWWDKVPNVAGFVQEIADSVISEKSIVLVLPEHIPWPETFQSLVVDKISTEISDKSISYIDCPGCDAGSYLLQEFCKEEKRLEYHSNKSYAQFLAESDDIVLNEKILWVRDLSAEKFKQWSDFVSEYQKIAKHAHSLPVFILEIHEDYLGRTAKSGLKKLMYNTRIDEFDTYAFLTMAVSKTTEERHLKHYFALLVAELCGRDVEISAVCIKYGIMLLKNPSQVLKQALHERGDCSVVPCSNNDINKRIWKAQLKILFPCIEDYREKFLQHYRESHLKSANYDEDMEIGSLYFYAQNGTLEVNRKECSELKLLKEARNTLAHLDVLTFEDVDRILRLSVGD